MQLVDLRIGRGAYPCIIKDGNVEQVWVDGSRVMRLCDTSHGNETFYSLETVGTSLPAAWMPAWMTLGEEYESRATVSIYYKEAPVRKASLAYDATTYLKLVRVDKNVTFGGEVIPVVYVVEGSDWKHRPFERWYLAPDLGYVRWENLTDGWFTEAVTIDEDGGLPMPPAPPAMQLLAKSKGW
jgi:hypothetical protein